MIAWFLLGISPVVFAWLWWNAAPYGRHQQAGWGPRINGRLGWLLMEWPTLLLFAWFGSDTSGPGWLAFVLWMLHYLRRTLLYPMLQATVRPMAMVVVLAGMGFQLANASANGLGILQPRAWTDPLLWGGVGVFLAGQVINLHGDDVLKRLRTPGDTNYHMPTAGLYRWVTNVSYLGEIITWAGWAVLTGSLAGFAFFCFTVANLAPRARSNAVWYQRTFDRTPGPWVLVPGVW